MPKAYPQIEVTSRAEWRAWLEAHYSRAEGIWLVTYKQHCGERYVPYDAIVEEALCFGWIDSLPRKLDRDRTQLYISPRRPGSPWSRLNQQRVQRLIKQGQMTAAGQDKIDQAQKDGSWSIYDEVEDLIIPPDLAAALQANEPAQGYFQAFSNSAKKGILWWIKSAKRPATREQRIEKTVRLAAENIKANSA